MGSTTRGRVLAALALVLLGGCASFTGAPDPVIPLKTRLENAKQFSEVDALKAFYSPNDADRFNMSPLRYRDLVIEVHMAASDAQFEDFKRRLSRESKGTNVGLDLLLLGLSAGGSLAGESTANALAAAAAGVTGSRASIGKELYYEKTLPALLASMDTARLEVATDIGIKRALGVEAYPLSSAFRDLSRYESAASLDSAIERVTATASAEANEAKAAFKAVGTACDPNPPRTEDLRRVSAGFGKIRASKDFATAKIVANTLGTQVVDGDVDKTMLNAAIFFSSQRCTEAATLIGDINRNAGRKVIE